MGTRKRLNKKLVHQREAVSMRMLPWVLCSNCSVGIPRVAMKNGGPIEWCGVLRIRNEHGVSWFCPTCAERGRNPREFQLQSRQTIGHLENNKVSMPALTPPKTDRPE